MLHSNLINGQATLGKGGVFYIASTANSLGTVNFDTVVVSNVKSLLSGSMVYSESPTAIFSSYLGNY